MFYTINFKGLKRIEKDRNKGVNPVVNSKTAIFVSLGDSAAGGPLEPSIVQSKTILVGRLSLPIVVGNRI